MKVTQTSNSQEYLWRVDVPRTNPYNGIQFLEVEAWMKVYMQGQWLAWPGVFLFEREQDATMFVLRWS